MAFYKDYFGIKPDWTPTMEWDSINKNPETWLDFYPHASFVTLLRELFKSLNGGTKPLWIHGAYGTGKTHTALALQKLFTDDDARVNKFLEKRAHLIPESVRSEILALRAQKILVAYDINSDGVDAKNQFLMRLQHKITEELMEKGLTIPMRGKLDEILERIKQDETYFFAKRDEMQPKLPDLHTGIKTTEELAKRLDNNDPHAGLISDIMKVLEARHIYLDTSAEEFMAWVDATLKQNGFAKLLYIWDEFSSFVDRNHAELKTMEQLASAAGQGRFYFIPVTHSQLSAYSASGAESAQKANNRFVFKNIDLPNEIALKLAADAFVIKEGKAEEWNAERYMLWHGVSGIAHNYMKLEHSGIEAEDFKGILPLHPMAAFLLKHLSVAVGANQRSMFEFLNGSEFRDFMATGGLDVPGRQFLTVDHLWEYFIERDDLGTRQEVRETKAEFARREPALQPDEQRVFKAVLLFGLIEQLQGSGHPLLNVRVENIKRSFEGDGNLQGLDYILKRLQENHCFTIINDRCERFHDRLDSKDLEAKKAALSGKFSDIVVKNTEEELGKFLKSNNPGERFDIRALGLDKLSASNIANKDSFGNHGNRILVQFVFAMDEEEQLRIHDKVNELAKNLKNFRMVFFTAPELHFCRDHAQAWETFVENSARLTLADSAGKAVFDAQIRQAREAWHNSIKNAAKLRAYKTNANGEPFIEEVTWSQIRKDWLTAYAKQNFAAYTDDLSDYFVGAFGQPTGLQNWALAGINFDSFTKPGQWKTVVTNWKKNGVNDSETWFEENPNHPLTQMRDFCKKRQDNTIGAGRPCSIRKLYDDLKQPPFGLLYVPHSAFVLGFVLKTWLTGARKLQWTDSITSKTLDAVTLAEIIESAVKNDSSGPMKYEKQICRQSEEDKTFIKQMPTMLDYPPPPDGTVEATLQAVAERLETISQGTPLWVLPEYIQAQDEPSAESMGTVIDALCVANSISSKGDTDTRSNKVREIGKLFQSTPGLAQAMTKFMPPHVFESAFRQYVDKAKPDLKMAAERMGDVARSYYGAIKKRLAATSGWLWKRGDIDAVLDEIYRQVLCAEHIRNLAGVTGYLDFENAWTRIKGAVLAENKIPTWHWVKKSPALTRFFDLLKRDQLSGEDVRTFEELLAQQAQTIRKIFFDVAQSYQQEAMREIFGELWPQSMQEGRELYATFPQDSASLDEQSFKEQGRKTIDEFRSKSVVARIAALWHEQTDTASPAEWGQKFSVPAECVLNADNAASLVEAMLKPGNLSAEHLRNVHDTLQKAGIFLDLSTAKAQFLARVLPARYLKFGLDADELCAWLHGKMGNDPNAWLADARLKNVVDTFVKHKYDTQFRKRAAERVKGLSDMEAKSILLKLIDSMPDVGLSLME
jgi:hypothetical protein